MPYHCLSDETLREHLRLLKEHGSTSAVAKALGMPRTTAIGRTHQVRVRWPEELPEATSEANWTTNQKPAFEIPILPDEEMGAEELIAYRMRAFERKKEAREARKLVPVNVKLDGPIGILHIGDPHVDDDGCDWPTLRHHVDLINRTEGLFGGNIGDQSNNWVGRLARLYGQQGTSAKQAWVLVEWLIHAVPWLYLIGGNHDAWSGEGDPIKWMAAFSGSDYTWHGTRLGLNLPNGRQCRVNARHDFVGSSQWNPAHGPQKAAMLGPSDHIYVSGHRHIFGSGWAKHPDGTWSCALRVGTYKVYDSYADAKGFPDYNLPAAVTLIFPDAGEEGFVELIKDVDRAADYLTWARAKHASGKTVKPCRDQTSK